MRGLFLMPALQLVELLQPRTYLFSLFEQGVPVVWRTPFIQGSSQIPPSKSRPGALFSFFR